MYIYSFSDLKLTLKHLKRSYIFRSYDHPQGATPFLAKVIVLKTLSHLNRYVELVLWRHVLCIV